MHRRCAHQKALRRDCNLDRNSLDLTPLTTFAVNDPPKHHLTVIFVMSYCRTVVFESDM